MLPLEDALDRILAGARQLGGERVGLRDAAGRVLAETVRAEVSLPRFDYSAMDGYALRATDVAGGGPWRLPVVGESRAGAGALSFRPGSACRIFTGAPLPEGADSVVIQEDVELQDGFVESTSPVPVGAHVRKAGEDLAQGEIALGAGRRLGPFEVGLAASLDRTSLCVTRRPRVVIVCTGDELRLPGSLASDATLPESNGLSVALQCERVGANAELAPLAADDTETLQAAIEGALAGADLLVTIGGVSVGQYDVVRPALQAAGGQLDFWKVKIKPGKPLAFGRAGRTLILGLPGNPVSSQITFALFGLPLLRALQGEPDPRPRFTRGRLVGAIEQKPGRMGFYRGRREADGVRPLPNQASGNVVSLTRADVLIVVPADSTGYPAGAEVDLLPLERL